MKHKIAYLARVEGEAAVTFEIKDGKLSELVLNIWEPPRFFEGFLAGRTFDEVPDIVARICGICPISHMTTAIRALGKALGLEPPPQTVALQEVMALSQIAASHLVHLYMLALPDFHGMASAAELLPRFEGEVGRFLRMKEVLNDASALYGGRALHPVSMVVAGFTNPPSQDRVGDIVRRLEGIKADALETVKMVAGLPVPDLTNEAEYAALKSADRYAVNAGRLASSGGIDAPEEDYPEYIEETQVPHANAKRNMVKGRGALMVGALARTNLKFAQLHDDAKAAAAGVGFGPPADNPFLNNLAQAVEVVHVLSRMIEILATLPGGRPWVEVRPREGEGSALTEAPRGLLFHSYTLDRRGHVVRANIVTPTAHNFMGLEENLRKLIEKHAGEEKDEIALLSEMLVRAYDPCFSCSVH
ncbi:MAG: Ni/Fe hydrogenase subunit alpha [Nitrospirota bacterium]